MTFSHQQNVDTTCYQNILRDLFRHVFSVVCCCWRDDICLPQCMTLTW